MQALPPHWIWCNIAPAQSLTNWSVFPLLCRAQCKPCGVSLKEHLLRQTWPPATWVKFAFASVTIQMSFSHCSHFQCLWQRAQQPFHSSLSQVWNFVMSCCHDKRWIRSHMRFKLSGSCWSFCLWENFCVPAENMWWFQPLKQEKNACNPMPMSWSVLCLSHWCSSRVNLLRVWKSVSCWSIPL